MGRLQKNPSSDAIFCVSNPNNQYFPIAAGIGFDTQDIASLHFLPLRTFGEKINQYVTVMQRRLPYYIC